METSNIIGGSNVYPCKGSPLSDQEFVNQIEDYNYIRTIHKMQEFRQSSVHLTKKQSQLLEIEMRCVYAKKDPCWGYINGQGIRSRCIEGRCPRIKNCNPTYTSEQQGYWTMSEEAKTLYGSPDKQKKYYLVDLVSDEEMSRYISNPKGAGMEYPPILDPKPKVPGQKKLKSRSLVIIGYEETYFGDADNQLSPIWGYVDDSEDGGSLVTHKYGSRKEVIHEKTRKVGDWPKKKVVKKDTVKPADKKIEVNEEQKKPVITDLDEVKKLQYEKVVKDKIGSSYQLTEITDELINGLSYGKILNIILSNEAEMAYVSSMLLQANIVHDIELCDGNVRVCLWKAQTKKIKFSSGITVVSSAFIRQGCSLETETVWAGLEKTAEINELVVSGRDFFGFEGKNNQKRWGCRNLYGATHIAIQNEDFKLSTAIEEEQNISLMKDSKNYIILSKANAEQLGVTTDNLWEALESLKISGEISEFPRLIAGLVLAKASNGYEIKGIGHMKFDEY